MGVSISWRSAVAVTGALVLGAALSGCGGTEPIEQPFASISTTTTRLASADIVGLDREPGRMCAPPLVGTGAPASLAVADPQLLDGLCALGLQERVRAVAGPVPEYLTPVFGAVAPLTAGTQVELALGSADSAEANRLANRPTVLPDPVVDWRRSFLALADAVRLPSEARAVLDGYTRDAADRSARINAVQQVVSLVRFTADRRALAEGSTPMAGQVLADLNVGRPEPQRTAGAVEMRDGDFGAAEADLIYVGFQGDDGRAFGTAEMTSPGWKELRAVVAKRQLLVQDSAWFGGSGPVAARIVLTDVAGSIRSSS